MKNTTNQESLNIKNIFSKSLRKNTTTLFVFLFILMLCVLLILNVLPSNLDPEHIILGFSITLIILFLYLNSWYLESKKSFWKKVAEKYTWKYEHSKNTVSEKGLLFNIGNPEPVQNCIVGNHNGQKIQIFEYSYILTQGKSKIHFDFTVFEISFSGTFPHLYLNYKKDWYSNYPTNTKLAKISLPTEFEEIFKIYAPKEYEIEILEILTPEILQVLIDNGWDYDMEFVDGELIIYKNIKFQSFEDMDRDLTKVRKLIDTLSPRLNKMKIYKIGDLPHHFHK